MVKLLKLDLYILYTVLYGVYYNLVRIGTQNICTSLYDKIIPEYMLYNNILGFCK